VHRFLFYPTPGHPRSPDLHGAYLVGAENVPVRGELRCEKHEVRCLPRTQDPVGLSLLWPVAGFGTLQLQTTRLPPREKPYNLHVELARHQLMRLTVKREEWGLFDYGGMDEITAQIDQSRDRFIRALQLIEKPESAVKYADESLAVGLWAAEGMARFHAAVFLGRRQQTGGFGRPFLAAALPDAHPPGPWPQPLAGVFDTAVVPLIWRSIQPTEQGPNWDGVDACVQAASAAKLALRGGPLLTFGVRSVPDWMYIWENDFESIYEAAREHVERTVQRYAKHIHAWVVASGLQADNVFGFSFEQTMELTRMAATVTKQIAPRSQVLIDLCQPWGEYYARHPQTVPPLLYADMAVQGGIPFDGFGVQFLVGLDAEGFHVRDPFQLSALLDRLANLGKPLHLTALGAPSRPVAEAAAAGEWHGPWSEATQADWLEMLCEIALSKPYVDSVCIQPVVDTVDGVIPHGGILHADLTPKPSFERLRNLRARLLSGGEK
jgi:hypothetical protein